MGTIPDPDYDEGDACALCFGPGKTFGDVPTPESVKVIFTGVTPCDLCGENLNGGYVLTQTSQPCRYEYSGADFFIYYEFFKDSEYPYAYLSAMSNTSGFQAFYGESAPCETTFSSLLQAVYCCTLNCAFGGSGEVSWGPEI